MFVAHVVQPLKLSARTIERLFRYDPWLLVVEGPASTFGSLIETVRSDRRLCAVPMLLLTDSSPEDVRRVMRRTQTIASVLYKPFQLEALANRVELLCQPPRRVQYPAERELVLAA